MSKQKSLLKGFFSFKVLLKILTTVVILALIGIATIIFIFLNPPTKHQIEDRFGMLEGLCRDGSGYFK